MSEVDNIERIWAELDGAVTLEITNELMLNEVAEVVAGMLGETAELSRIGFEDPDRVVDVACVDRLAVIAVELSDEYAWAMVILLELAGMLDETAELPEARVDDSDRAVESAWVDELPKPGVDDTDRAVESARADELVVLLDILVELGDEDVELKASHWVKSPEAKFVLLKAPPPVPVVSAAQYSVYELPAGNFTIVLFWQTAAVDVAASELEDNVVLPSWPVDKEE
ncbi:hypothetical protein LTR08_008015 [Meristemomyces frigidus]|nr:hypothetical protein LTR08_008015 [Meristemomyces frigidus]